MAASPWQVAGGAHTVPSSRNPALHRSSAAPRRSRLVSECTDFVSSSTPATPDCLGQREHGEISWDRDGNGARDLHSQRGQQELPGPPPSTTLRNRFGPRRIVGYTIGASARSVSQLCEMGQLSEAVESLEVLVEKKSRVSKSLLYNVLKGCVARKSLVQGRRVHQLIVRLGHESNTFLANHILRMYASHGRLQEAKDVFTRVAKPDVFSWSAVIAAHAKHGDPEQAVQLYQTMRSSGVKPDCHLFVAALQACGAAADVEAGRQVHADVVRSGIQPDLFVWNCLVDMYVKCGRLEEARRVFDSLSTKSVVTWTAMIAGYAKHGPGQEALALYDRMEQQGLIVANSVTLACLLKACATAGALQQGKQLHSQILGRGLESDVVVATCLVDMYAKCGSLDDARAVFDGLAVRDVVTWSAMIAGYADHGLCQEALALHASMEQEGLVLADSITFSCLLRACASTGAVQQGKQLHLQIVERGLEADILVGNSLVDMYAKCGRLQEAHTVFDSLPTKDVVTWTAMIGGYAEHGLGQEALALYGKMEQEGLIPANSFTFACLFKACGIAGALQEGKQLHSEILERGLGADAVLGTCLVDMYLKCGRLEDAHKVFDGLASRDVVAWNAMINGYAEQALGQEALALYDRMVKEGLVIANSLTFVCLLKACATLGDSGQGKHVHSQILERGLEEVTVVRNCLIDMYVKCGRLEDARSVFDSFATRDVVTWTTMINGYAEHGLGQEALALYDKMKAEGLVLSNSFTFACLLKACVSVAALQQGKQLHAQIVERALEADTVVGTCLVDLYAKCGRLDDARRIFDSLPSKDVVTWNAMMDGFAQNYESQKAIKCFEEMMLADIQADETTFTCLLVACSHEGLVKEGLQYFKAMVEECGVMPTIEHKTCMVDLLGRAGYLDEAEKMLSSFESNDVGLFSLLNACRNQGDIERGKRCFESIVRSDSQNAGAYVLMGNIYADAGRWSDVEMLERLRKSAGASKKPAVAGIEVNRHVHTFIVGEERGDISAKLQRSRIRLKEEGGHVPHTQLVLKQQLSVEEKEDELCGHAEKLALAYGLLNTPDGTPLLVTKNLRMCGDCHSSTEIMSRVEKREIVVRDAHRVHRFVDGSCHCGGRP